ncbi:MAG: hypothetical protein IPK17_16430 [Chloroflexi bacterium]|uniref:hypothetical protein n=1 Tax=Candidatus Flexifilum breve TaxID=3140694 RepID=UPI0031353BAB|nr:hypothetical protein [Chloroflexota bacterium]
MSGGGLIIGIVMLLAGLAYLALPFVRGSRGSWETEQERERLRMIAAYERALVTVRDLDEDYHVGKLTQEIYEAERQRWTEHGAMLLQKLEETAAGDAKQNSKRRKTVEPTVSEEDAVEQAIAAYVRAREQTKVQEKN